MAELTANAVQNVAVGQNVIYTDVPISGMNDGIIHRDGSGIVTLSGRYGTCGRFAEYRITFGGNVAIPEGGDVAPLSLAIAIDGEPIPTSAMIVTPAAASQYWNVGASILISLPRGCCYTVAVENTGTTPFDIQNVNFIVERVNF